MAAIIHTAVAPSNEQLWGEGRCGVFTGKTVWSTPERLRVRGEVLTMRRYTNLRIIIIIIIMKSYTGYIKTIKNKKLKKKQMS